MQKKKNQLSLQIDNLVAMYVQDTKTYSYQRYFRETGKNGNRAIMKVQDLVSLDLLRPLKPSSMYLHLLCSH